MIVMLQNQVLFVTENCYISILYTNIIVLLLRLKKIKTYGFFG